MLFSQLSDIVHGKLFPFEDCIVSRFSTDSRTAIGLRDEVFFGLKAQRDGSDFAVEAYKSGIRNFVLSKKVELPESNLIIVSNPLRALQELARHHRAKFDIPVIAITGSNGKTFVKEWIATLLEERFFPVKSPKSYNSQIGVPLSLLNMRSSHEVGIFEAGISQVGEMEKLEQLLEPSHGVFTNLGEAHDDGFSSVSEKRNEKLKLFNDASTVVCRADKWYSKDVLALLGSKAITWSLSDSDASYRVRWGHEFLGVNELTFTCPFTSNSMMENLTHAVVLSLELGLTEAQVQRGINRLRPVAMRLELKKGVNGCYLLDDTYNSDIGGLTVALAYLGSQRENQKKTVILSDILHSARTDQELYREVADLLTANGIDRLIGVGSRISSCSHLFEMKSDFFQSTDDLLGSMPAFDEEMILIKGARDFRLEKVVAHLEARSHGTALEVNFEALGHNLNQYRRLLNPETEVMVMVKANAYGCGLLEVANFLQYQRIDRLGVAYVDEAIQLRENGIHIPIMVMNPYIDSFDKFEKYDIEAEIISLRHFDRMVSDTKKPPCIHIKIDTGMHRLGFSPEQVPALIQRLKENPSVKVTGILTHFASAEDPQEDAFTRKQMELFEKAYAQIVEAIGYNPTKHACNSPAIVRWPQFHHDMVRLGIGLHGFDTTGTLKLRFPATLRTVISQIQHLKKGDTVGYSRKGKITKESEIAVLPIGYEDGYLRVFGNGIGQVLIRGERCRVIGNVCMDMTMVDVTGVGASAGDEVIIFGREPTIIDLAESTQTIPYEILTNVSSRVKRVFISE